MKNGPCGLITFEDELIIILWKARNLSASDTASHLRNLKSSSTPPHAPQNLGLLSHYQFQLGHEFNCHLTRWPICISVPTFIFMTCTCMCNHTYMCDWAVTGIYTECSWVTLHDKCTLVLHSKCTLMLQDNCTLTLHNSCRLMLHSKCTFTLHAKCTLMSQGNCAPMLQDNCIFSTLGYLWTDCSTQQQFHQL
jgi:hypothetical protein